MRRGGRGCSDGGKRRGRSAVVLLALIAAGPALAAMAIGPPGVFPFAPSPDRRPQYRLTIPVPPARRTAPPRILGDAARPLVVIDPGHGGIDPGAVDTSTGLREKDVALGIALAIRDELLAGDKARVALTREDDRFLTLGERYGVARRIKADLFISVHCDSAGDRRATGASAYTLSEVASDREAARTATRENQADPVRVADMDGAGADVSSILVDLARRETMTRSAGFARLLGREARPLAPVKAQFHRMAGLKVLRAPDMPSILFETGYLSHPEDAAFLDSADGRNRLAKAVRRAAEAYFARRSAAR